MSREAPQFKLRMPDDLKQVIEDSARANGRSMNAEIVGRLEQSLEAPKVTLTDAQAAALADEIMAKIETRKISEPAEVIAADLNVDTVEQLIERLDHRATEQSEAIGRLIKKIEHEAHDIYLAEGESERYESVRKQIPFLREFQIELSFRSAYFHEIRERQHQAETQAPESETKSRKVK
ncbi:TPA: Arc family DNA-binding protein [Stenotrophomonas maltophilia]|nr:Arc family DNA-binding protein [Stenotrophomonas maltophilia]